MFASSSEEVTNIDNVSFEVLIGQHLECMLQDIDKTSKTLKVKLKRLPRTQLPSSQANASSDGSLFEDDGGGGSQGNLNLKGYEDCMTKLKSKDAKILLDFFSK